MCLGIHMVHYLEHSFDHCVFYAEINMNLSQRPCDLLALTFVKTKLFIPYYESESIKEDNYCLY